MRIVRASSCRVMPWKNGGGSTTEIAVFPAEASLDGFEWRISMAHVGMDGPFSSFPGIDRTLAVLAGGGIALASAEDSVVLERGSEPHAFPGERGITGRLVDGPIDDLNVMTRRGIWRHRMHRITGTGPHELDIDAGLLVLVTHRGSWNVKSGQASEALAAGDSAMVDGPTRVELNVAEPDAELFAIRLLRVGSRLKTWMVGTSPTMTS